MLETPLLVVLLLQPLAHQALHRGGVAGSKVLSSASSMFRAVPPRAMRKTSIPIQRAHHWGFKSLQPAPPLKPQQLMALREVRVGRVVRMWSV